MLPPQQAQNGPNWRHPNLSKPHKSGAVRDTEKQKVLCGNTLHALKSGACRQAQQSAVPRDIEPCGTEGRPHQGAAGAPFTSLPPASNFAARGGKPQGRAGARIGTATSAILRGPTGFTTVRTGEIEISAGAMLSPWVQAQDISILTPAASICTLCAKGLAPQAAGRKARKRMHMQCPVIASAHLSGDGGVVRRDDDQRGRDGCTLHAAGGYERHCTGSLSCTVHKHSCSTGSRLRHT